MENDTLQSAGISFIIIMQAIIICQLGFFLGSFGLYLSIAKRHPHPDRITGFDTLGKQSSRQFRLGS
jgi:hypothetical protein